MDSLDERLDNTSTQAFYSIAYKIVVNSMDFESQLPHLPALKSCRIYPSFPHLSFFIFKTGILIKSQDGCEN